MSKEKNGSKNWKSLYQMGGIAALLAAVIFRRNLSAEVSLFSSIQPPQFAGDWFVLLSEHPLLGLTYLNLFDLVEYTLVGLMFLALYAVLRKTARSWMMIAVVFGLLGVGLNFASNQAIAMLSLSGQYMAANSEVVQTMSLAAGQSLLAQSQGSAAYASLFFISLAGLITSILMLRSTFFNRTAGVLGLLANGIMLLYFIVLPITPTLMVLPFVLSAPFRVAWYVVVGIRLLKLSRGQVAVECVSSALFHGRN